MSNSTDFQEPRLLPALLDHRAARQPDQVWAKFPVSPTSYEQGFRAATYSQMRKAVDSVAWLFDASIGSRRMFDTLAYMGPGDLRYHIVLLAAIKTGHKPFFPSPRNSIAAQKHLLSRLDTRVLVTTDPEPPFVASLRREYPIEVIHIPSLDDLLASQDVSAYPYEKTFEEARNEPAFVLHTSGSTGIPKPLIYTHEFVWRMYAATTLPPPDGLTRIDQYFLQGEWFSFLPAFHIAGLGFAMILSMYSQSVPVLPLPGRPPSTDAFLEAVKHGTFNWAFVVPVILDDLSKDPAALDLVASKLQYIFYTGGALPSAAGKIVSSEIPVFSGLGSSEFSALPQLRIADPSFTETWQYLYIHPTVQPQFRQRMDDLHELVLVRSAQNLEAQPIFAMFPGLDEYETRNLFSPHPTLPNLWRHRGRRDDIVVFLNGEKTNPVTFEQQVSRHPDVRSALVAGSQRFEACLLIEPVTTEVLSDAAKAELIEAVWPVVEEANAQCPAHAQVSKPKILVLDAAQPMLRAGKGTVQRAGTIQLYQDEIDALYEETQIQEPPKQKLSSLQEAIQVLRTLVAEVTSWSEFENHADFFALGMDSLQALRLTAAIRFTLAVFLSPSAIYASASIDRLATVLYSDTPADTGDDRMITMSRLLHSYEHHIDQLASGPNTADIAAQALPVPQVIILTGSTGIVGSFLLDHLLATPGISHIYCLNRARPQEEDPRSSQAAGHKRKNLTHALSEEKVTFLTVDLAKDRLGLDADDYNALVSSVTQIIHAAWPVNFIQPLHSFKPSLAGLLNLIALTREGRCRPSLLFLSSIAAVSSYKALPGAGAWIPEEIITDPLCTATMGYGESKYVAERILDYACRKLSTPCAIARVGQICGTATNPRGWNKSEWLPSLVVSSLDLGALPSSLGGGEGQFDEIDWIPVDVLAPILAELSIANATGDFRMDAIEGSSKGARVFHCVNPRRVQWQDMIPVVVEELQTPGRNAQAGQVSVVSLQEWVGKLQASIGSEGVGVDIDRNPAAKLVGFYKQLLTNAGRVDTSGVARFSTDKTAGFSKELKESQVIRPEWMRGWIREWLD
ncbi:putative NRPS-like enzyme [Aspergillus steynii IBT 23096]|uniref:Putative NRPS-like enzyme n=1 Tax=Aspergillus steynii IBT 23096 TaxID=1392250 RepID=A0A2I2FSE7_9EURO|nr:putative NRPS-like enzyme [Aspergillus steynii IBT 23096]PLB43526.1 putative NRPS-like enzyme [Aspergillus steynii IBT 23096]